jgi:gas vesicle protein
MSRRKTMEKTDQKIKMVALFSFLIGGVVGSGLAFPLAPQSGKKTRKQIMHMAEDVRDYAGKYSGRLRKRLF